MALIEKLNNLGDAVRERTSTTALLTINEMADKVRKIPYPQTDTITITANGTYSAPTGIDGYSKVDVNVEPELEEITITENGTYLPDAFGYSKVDVIVEPTLESITITENGTYTPLENIDGYNEIIVNTPVPIDPVIQEITITENGTYSATDGVDGYNPIIVNVPTDGGGDIEVEPIVLTGDQTDGCVGAMSATYIKLFGDTISTNEISDATAMFKESPLEEIPFDINLNTTGTTAISLQQMFFGCSKLKSIPKIIGSAKNPPTGNYSGQLNISYLFWQCIMVREISNDFFWKYIPNEEFWIGLSDKCSTTQTNVFSNCFSLRELPDLSMFANVSFTSASDYRKPLYNNGFNSCYTLNEIRDLPVIWANGTVLPSSNMFSSTFQYCSRIKSLTFATNEDGTPIIANWKTQTIDLSQYVGYQGSAKSFTNYNSGITEDKLVDTIEAYQALKNDSDWFAITVKYSRYNHDSAVETINSLPDTSAYLATNGGTNTIKFKGQSGASTDGGAINTLTEEEIAVATAKGWTVSLT